MVNAPLIIGYDLRKLTAELLAIFGNADIVALNQDPAGNQAVLAYDSDEVQIFVKTLADGSKGVAIFNRTALPAKALLTAEHLKLLPTPTSAARPVEQAGAAASAARLALTLAPRETLVFRATRHAAAGRRRSISPSRPASVNPAADGVVVPEPDPTDPPFDPPWTGTRGAGEHPQYGGWGGARGGPRALWQADARRRQAISTPASACSPIRASKCATRA